LPYFLDLFRIYAKLEIKELKMKNKIYDMLAFGGGLVTLVVSSQIETEVKLIIDMFGAGMVFIGIAGLLGEENVTL
jgi:hypothetical protein